MGNLNTDKQDLAATPDGNADANTSSNRVPDDPLANGNASSTLLDSSRSPRRPEHLLNRLRLVLWGRHQVLVAGMLVGMLVLMTVFFSARWIYNGRLVDIDDASALTAEFKIDINSAELGELVLLPGVGRKLALAIIDRRQAAGRFKSIDELIEVPGIGAKKLAALKPYLLPISGQSETDESREARVRGDGF